MSGKKPDHPSPKPLDFMLKLIKRFTEAGDTVIDPFMGSGTTALVCERLQRRWIGIELSRDYCDLIKQRIEREKSQLVLAL